MKLDETNLLGGVHGGLLEVISAEDPALNRESPDTRSLAARLLEIARLEGTGKALAGQYDAELDHRARLLCAVAGVETKGKWARVGRAVACYARALTAALGAVEGAGT